ncbi:MAG: hypothetical protein U5K43_12280 [Halofilum sp. (in: g-proteobacteria)]|nr:hypothetical protein [Halofilum sp. (in: g-proteobacteria)]
MDGTIGLGDDQAALDQAPHHLGNGGLAHTHAARDLYRARLAARVDQVGDQLHVVLDQLGLVRLAHAGVLACLAVGGGHPPPRGAGCACRRGTHDAA